MKECNKCKQVLALDMFYSRSACCKECEKIQKKIHRANNIEKYKASDNSEKHKSNTKKWYKNNKEYLYQYVKNKEVSILPGVYLIRNVINGKCYVGQSKRPYKRSCEHFTIHNSDKSTGYNPNVYADLKQYGKQAFVFGIIEHCEPEQLREREQYYINLYKPEYN